LSAGPPLATCKVLVVEDEPVQALELEAQLQDLGCAVLGPAGSSLEARRIVRRERPNAVLLDWLLLDGSAAALVRQLAIEDVPFAVVTALEPDRLDDPLVRGRPLLRKPYTVPALRATVRQLVRLDLTRALALTEGRIARARHTIEQQAQTVARWRAKDRDTLLGEEVLRTYERTLAVLEERRDLLVRELERQGGRAEFPGWPGP
jgi:two-component system, response regulator PdtaR